MGREVLKWVKGKTTNGDNGKRERVQGVIRVMGRLMGVVREMGC